MNWETIEQNIGKNAMFSVNDEYVNIQINNVNTTEDGHKWFTYVFLDHQNWSPTLFGYNLNYANCCWTDPYRGYYSENIKKSLMFIE